MFIYLGFFSFAQPNGVCGTSVYAKKKTILYLNTQKVLKYQTTEKEESNKIELGKLINYLLPTLKNFKIFIIIAPSYTSQN